MKNAEIQGDMMTKCTMVFTWW